MDGQEAAGMPEEEHIPKSHVLSLIMVRVPWLLAVVSLLPAIICSLILLAGQTKDPLSIDLSYDQFRIEGDVTTQRDDMMNAVGQETYYRFLNPQSTRFRLMDNGKIDAIIGDTSTLTKLPLNLQNASLYSRGHHRQMLQSKYPVPRRKWGGETLKVIYVSETNLLTEQQLIKIKQIENQITSYKGYSDYCRIFFDNPPEGSEWDDCSTPNSINSFMFPSITDEYIVFDGKGDLVPDLEAAIAALLSLGRSGFTDRSCTAEYPRSKTLISTFSFGLPLEAREYTSTNDRIGEQRRVLREYMASYEPLFQSLDRRKDELGFRVLREGGDIVATEVASYLNSDAVLTSISFALVSGFMVFHTRSVFLTFFGLLGIVASFPLPMLIAKDSWGSTFNLLTIVSVWIILGIGADDVFVFVDTWKQAPMLPANDELPRRDMSLDQRLTWAYKKAGSAMLVTSLTTASAFYAMAVSAIPPLRQFGIFMGLLVTVNYVMVMTWFPCVMVMRSKLLRKRWFRRLCCECTKKGVHIPGQGGSQLGGAENSVSDGILLPQEEDKEEPDIKEEDEEAEGLEGTEVRLEEVEMDEEQDIEPPVRPSSGGVMMCYHKYLFKMRYVVTVLWLIVIIFMGSRVPLLQLPRKLPQLLPMDSNVEMLLEARTNLQCENCLYGEVNHNSASAPPACKIDVCGDPTKIVGLVPSPPPAPTPAPPPPTQPTVLPTSSPVPPTSALPTFAPSQPTAPPTLPPTSAAVPTTATPPPTSSPNPPTNFPTPLTPTPLAPAPPTPAPSPAPSTQSNPPTKVPSQSPTPPSAPPSTNVTPPPNTAPPTAPTTTAPTTPPTTKSPTSLPPPSLAPSRQPSSDPTLTSAPTTAHPTPRPASRSPTNSQPPSQSLSPTNVPSRSPTNGPPRSPTNAPSTAPLHTQRPSRQPPAAPTSPPTSPTRMPPTSAPPTHKPAPRPPTHEPPTLPPTRRPTRPPSQYTSRPPTAPTPELAPPPAAPLSDNLSLQLRFIWGVRAVDMSSADDEHPGQPQYDKMFDLADPAALEHVAAVCREIDNAEDTRDGKTTCMIRNFDDWLKAHHQLPLAREDFMPKLIEFLDGPGAGFQGSCGLTDDQTGLAWFSANTHTFVNKNGNGVQLEPVYDRWESFMSAANRKGPPSAGQGFVTSSAFVRMQVELAFISGTIQSIIVSTALVLATIVLFTGDIMLMFLAVLTIVGTVVSLLGSFVLWGWPLGALESIAASLTVGLSVDYCLHIAHSYSHTPKTLTRFERTQMALGSIGPSVLAASATTVFSMCVLFFCSIHPFVVIGVIVAATLTLGIIFSLGSFTAFLMIVGPRGDTWNIAHHARRLCNYATDPQVQFNDRPRNGLSSPSARRLSDPFLALGSPVHEQQEVAPGQGIEMGLFGRAARAVRGGNARLMDDQ